MDCSGLRGRPSHVVTARGLALLLPKKYAVDAAISLTLNESPNTRLGMLILHATKLHCPSLKALAPFFLCLAVSNVQKSS